MLDTGMLDIKPIPEYGGQYCTSDCRRNGCEHKENFEEENGIKHVEVKWSDNGKMKQVDNNVFLK